MNSVFSDGWSVKTWYDRRSRNWITQILARDGNQVGNAEFAGSQNGGEFNHDRAVADCYWNHGPVIYGRTGCCLPTKSPWTKEQFNQMKGRTL